MNTIEKKPKWWQLPLGYVLVAVVFVGTLTFVDHDMRSWDTHVEPVLWRDSLGPALLACALVFTVGGIYGLYLKKKSRPR